MPAGIVQRFEYMGECLACTPVAHPRTEPPDLYLILHRGDHRCAARSPAGGIVLRLTPLRSATVPRIAIIIIITTAGDGDPGQRQHHRSAGRWPRTPLFSALLPLTAFVVLNASISPAATIIL
jgi:hypothetical protein